MTIVSKFGMFNTGTGGVGTTVVSPSLGFAPKAVILWCNGRTETVDTAGRASHKLGMGIAVSASDRRCVATQSADNLPDAAADHGHYNDACLVVLTTAGAVDGALDVQSMDADTFTLVVDNQFAASYRVQFLALGGEAISNYASGQFQEPGATGNQDTTTVGFQPDFVLLLGTPNTSAPGATGIDSWFSIGAAVSSTKQGVWAGGSNDAAATIQSLRHARQGDQCVILYDAGVTAVNAEASFVSFLSNGFRLNWISRASTRYIHFLALKGGKYDVGELLTQVDTTTDIVVTNGFRPSGGLLVGTMNTESSTTTAVTSNAQLSIGAFSSVTDRGMMAVTDRDNVVTSEVYTTVDADSVYRNENVDGTLIALMDIKSIEDTGFTSIMDDAESGQRFIWYMVFGVNQQDLSLSGSVASSGAMLKSPNKLLASSVGSSGVIGRSTTKLLSSTTLPSGSLVKAHSRSLSAAVSTIGLILKSILKTIVSSLQFQVNQSSDDGRELGTGAVSFSTGVLTVTSDDQWLAFRFRNIFIPTGKLILSASMTVEVVDVSADNVAFDLYAEELANPATLTTASNDISGRTRTSNKVTWSANNIGAGQKTSPDLTSILQEVVDSVGINGSVVIIWDALSGVNFSIVSYDGNPSLAAKLNIETNIGSFTSISGTLLNQPTKLVAGSIAVSGALSYIPQKVLSGTIAVSGTIVESISRLLSGTVSISGSILKQISRVLSGSVGSSGTSVQILAKLFSGTVASSGTISRSTTKLLSSTTSISGAISNSISKALSGTIGVEGTLVIVRLVFLLLEGTIAISGTVFFTTSKLFISTTSATGVLLKSISRSLSGTIGIEGALTIVRMIILLLEGTVTIAGTILKSLSKLLDSTTSITGTLLKLIPKSFSGTVDSSGEISNTKSFLLTLAGSVGSSGTIIKLVSKLLESTISSSGNLLKSISLTLNSLVTPTGTVLKITSKSFSGTVSSSSVISTLKSFLLTLNGEIPSTGTIIKSISRLLSGTVSSSGNLLKSISITLVSSIGSSGTILKTVSKGFSGTTDSSGTVSTLRSFLLTLNGTVTSSGTTLKIVSKLLSGTISSSGTLIKLSSKLLSGTVSSSANLIRTFSHILSGTVGTIGNPDSGNLLTATGTVTSSGNLLKSVNKSLTGTVSVSGSISKFFSQLVSGSIAISGVLSTAIVGLQVVQVLGRAMFRGMFRKMR